MQQAKPKFELKEHKPINPNQILTKKLQQQQQQQLQQHKNPNPNQKQQLPTTTMEY